MYPKVSIITSCYNGEVFIDRYVDNILHQMYKNIEIIFVNDGSNDNTKKKIFSYKKKMEENSIILRYFEQENQGLAVAANVGLKKMTGKYFIFYDIDDILLDDCLKSRVDFLEKNSDFGFVRSKALMVYEDDMENKKPQKEFEMVKKSGWIFNDLIEQRIGVGTFYYLFRTSDFLKINPTRTIYETRACQDCQINYMMAYYYKCGFIDEYQGIYVRSSRSHSGKSSREMIDLVGGYKSAVIHTIKSLDISPNKMNEYIERVICNYSRIQRKCVINLYLDLLKDNVMISHKYIIFGAGIWGAKMVRLLGGGNVEYLVDNNSIMWGKKIDGVEINSPRYLNADKDIKVIIAAKNGADDIKKQLLTIGFDQKNIIFYLDFICTFIKNDFI